jgi:O-antigen/teichoic acid export membrane protein
MADRPAKGDRQSGVLGKNTVINLLGQAVPLFFALLALPYVIHGLGTERFGVLMTIWVVTGYFSLFDMGLGRATTKFVADQDAEGGHESLDIITTSLLLLCGVGLAGSLIVVFTTPWLVESVLNIPSDLIRESKASFIILSFSIPFVLGAAGARGVLEARQQFGIVNAIKIPASLINYVGPVPVLFFTDSLVPIVILLIAARIVTFFIYGWFSIRGERLRSLGSYQYRKWTRKLMGFGAWLTVSNLISPIMVYMDRFIIGAILTMTAVTYYTTPYEVISRLLIVPGSFMAVMFPAFSVYTQSDGGRFLQVFTSSLRYLFLAIAPVVLFVIIAADPLLTLWLGTEFAENSTLVLQLLALGMLIVSLAMVPYSAIQAAGKPDVIAKIHMAELPVYLLMIWYFTINYGIGGVALAWTLRVLIDAILMFWFFRRTLDARIFRARKQAGNLLIYGGFSAIMIFITSQISGAFMTIFLGLFAGGILFITYWKRNLNDTERKRVIRLMQNFYNVTVNIITRKNGHSAEEEGRP